MNKINALDKALAKSIKSDDVIVVYEDENGEFQIVKESFYDGDKESVRACFLNGERVDI